MFASKMRIHRVANQSYVGNMLIWSCKRFYAKKIAAAASAGSLTLQPQKKRLPVETDPVKLTTYCCGSNIYKEGEDVRLGEDSEYPDWLWDLKLDGPPRLQDLDPSTAEYWERLHYEALLHQNKLRSKAPKPQMRINEKDKMKKLKGLRFRALASLHYDPGVSLERTKEKWKKQKLDW